jgi:hypothetical protein
LDDYGGPFDADFQLERLSRAALVWLGREYMLYGHIRDRGLMPHVGARFGPAAPEEISILEWMGASPLYTRRMRRAMRIEGDDVAAIMKSLQLDVGFPHRYMDVHYAVESESVGHFWLDSCGALLDVEPFGEKAVISMCHAIEDPTFDATAYAVNPRARVRPIHRPPREPADRVPHCHWEIRIDPANEPAPEPPITRRVRAGRLAEFELDPTEVPEGEGRPDYAGPFDPDFRLDHLSRRALVVACKEFLLQSQLLTRASMIAIGERFGEQAAREILMTQWRAVAPLTTRRLCQAMRIEGGDAAAILKTLQLHPLLPRDYLRLGFELAAADRGFFWLEDCAALDDDEPKGLLSLLDDPECPGFAALVEAVNPRARCGPVDAAGRGAARQAWEVIVDENAEPAAPPREVGFVEHSTVSRFSFENEPRSQARRARSEPKASVGGLPLS